LAKNKSVYVFSNYLVFSNKYSIVGLSVMPARFVIFVYDTDDDNSNCWVRLGQKVWKRVSMNFSILFGAG